MKGYALLLAIIGVSILAIFLMMAKPLWETEIRRDLEEEYFFRARQYVQAIQLYQQKNKFFPKTLAILFKEKFIRKLYDDPLSSDGKWDLVFQDAKQGGKKLLLVPLEVAGLYFSTVNLLGVCSTSPETGFREYRKKKKCNEWAVYLGEKLEEEMPELQYIGGK